MMLKALAIALAVALGIAGIQTLRVVSVQNDFAAYQVKVKNEIVAEKDRQINVARGTIATLETQLASAKSEATAAEADADALREWVAKMPAIPGRGATETDVRILNGGGP